jgi:hypothetical protein
VTLGFKAQRSNRKSRALTTWRQEKQAFCRLVGNFAVASGAADDKSSYPAHVYCGLPESDKRLVLWRGIRKLEDDQASDAPHQLLHLTQAREKNG